MQNNPNTKPEFFEPVKVFLAILLASLFFFAPIAQPAEEETPKELQPVLTGIQPFASNADACPFKCVRCITYDLDSWPRTCIDYYCDSDCENDPGGGGGGGPTYSPPTITHTLNCAQSGLNSWCIGALSVDLNASDPQGQSIIISGDINGANFTCTTNPCTLNLPEGSGLVTYKVDSATGLSASGSAFFYLDVTTPQISGGVNGSTGNSGWYITQAVASASASDQVSGLASFEVSVNGASYTNYQSPIAFNDGVHSIRFRATDNAGNVTETALQSVNVDTTAPTLNFSTTGTTGNNGWYVSNVTLTPTATDAGSGLAAVEMTADGGPWTAVISPITLTDGIYTVQFRAIDRAGNVSQTAVQQVKVDATTPSLSLNVSGTRGQNDWYTSTTSVTPNASDAGSGINTIEAKINGGTWSIVNGLSSFTDGIHSYQYRVTDQAGNVTETPVLPMRVDTVPPAVAVHNEPLGLGDTLIYDLEDSLSGLWISRSVIEDDAEKYKKIVWLEEITGNKSNDNEIRWDGIFADGTKAVPGQYFITLKISDQAGNETMRTAIVEVTAFNSILPIPVFTPPTSTLTEPAPGSASTTNEQSFGGANNGNMGAETTTTNGETVFMSVNIQAGGMNSFSSGNQTTSTPISNPNILWGAAAAAMLGATLAEWQKKREEEAARLAALIASNAGQGDEDEIPPDVLAKRRGKAIAKNEAKRAQERVWEAARTQQHAKPVNQLAKIDTEEERLEAYKQTAGYQARQESYAEYYAKKEQEKQNAVSTARWAGMASVAQDKEEVMKNAGGGKPLAIPAKQDNPPWWEKITNAVEQAWNVTKTATISAWNSTKSITTNAWKFTKTIATDFSNLVKTTAKESITKAAEWIYQNRTVPVVTFAEKHPLGTKMVTQMLNLFINSEKEKMSPFTDTNPESMTWTDLGKVWLYEYGSGDTIKFDSDAALIKEVMVLDGVQSYREEVINNLRNGKIEGIIQKPVEYGVDQFGYSLVDALMGKSGDLFLGSYTVSIVVEPKGNGVYVLNYELKNPSTWASATRFRNDNDGDGSHDAIVPDATPRGEGIELGGRLDEIFTWSEEIQIPNGDGK